MPRVFAFPDYIPDGPQRRSLLRRERFMGFAAKGEAALGTEFFASSLAWGWYAHLSAGAHHDAVNNITAFAWQASNDGGATTEARVVTYDHATGQWGPEVVAGTQMLADVTDGHDMPAIIRGPNGYWYIAYGAHNDVLRLAYTPIPDDLTYWAPLGTPSGTTYAYPSWFVDEATGMLGLLSRFNLRFGRILTATTFTNGRPTWNAAVDLVSSDDGVGDTGRVYHAAGIMKAGELHFRWSRADNADTERKHVYYFVVEFTAGAVSGVRNYDDTQTILTASLPMNLAAANADYRIFEHTGGNIWTNFNPVTFDGDDNPHVFFLDGSTGSSDPGNGMHIWHNGTAWQTPEVVSADVFGVNKVAEDDGSLTLYYDRSGWKQRPWTAGGGLGIESDAEFVPLPIAAIQAGTLQPIVDGHANARLIFAEATSNPPNDFGTLKAYAHGDGGYLRRTASASIITSLETETQDYFDRLSAVPSAAQERHIVNRIFVTLKDLGISRYDSIALLCVGDPGIAVAADALLDILGSSFGWTNQGAAFTPGAGFNTDGVATYVEGPLANATAAALQNSTLFGFHTTTEAVVAAASGQFDGTDGTTIGSRFAGDIAGWRTNSGSHTNASSITDGRGFWAANRSASNASQLYRNAVSLVTDNDASAARNNLTYKLGTPNLSGFAAQAFSFVIIGGSHSAAEMGRLWFEAFGPLMLYKRLMPQSA